MRTIRVIDKKDLKGKIIGLWIYDLPLFLRGEKGSKKFRLWQNISKITFRFKKVIYKSFGKTIPPTFEVAINPTIKLSDIKERRFHIVD